MAAAKIQEEQRVEEEQLGVRCAMMDWLTGKMMEKDTISSKIEVSREYSLEPIPRIERKRIEDKMGYDSSHSDQCRTILNSVH